MKTVHLESLIEIYRQNRSKGLPPSYMNYLCAEIKKVDLGSLECLIDTIKKFELNPALNIFLFQVTPEVAKPC